MEIKENTVTGLEGWLRFHSFWLPITIVITLLENYYILRIFIPTIDSEMASIFNLLAMTDIVFIFYLSYITFLFFNKDYRLPEQINAFYLISVLYSLFVLYMLSKSSYTLKWYDYKEFIQSVIFTIIWIPYFTFSERVKNTFRAYY